MHTFFKLSFIILLSYVSLLSDTHIVSKSSPVCTSGDNTHSSIQDALNNVSNNDEIIICNGTYTEELSRDDTLSGITIGSFNNDKTAVTIRHSDIAILLENFSNLTIKDLTIISTGDNALQLTDIRGDVNLTNLDLSGDATSLDIAGGNGGYNLYLTDLDISDSETGINLEDVKNLTVDGIDFDTIGVDAFYVKSTLNRNSIHSIKDIYMQHVGNTGIEYKSCTMDSLSMSAITIGSDPSAAGGMVVGGMGFVYNCDADLSIDGMAIYSDSDGMELTSEGNYNLKNINIPITGRSTESGILIEASDSSIINLESINIGSIIAPDHHGISIDTCLDIRATYLVVSGDEHGFFSTDCSGKIEILDSKINSLEKSTIHIDESDELIISGTCVAEVAEDIDAIFLGEDAKNVTIKQNYIPTSYDTNSKGSFGLHSESKEDLLVYDNCFKGPAGYLVSVAGDSSHTNFDNAGVGNFWENFNLNDGAFTVNASENIFDNHPLIKCRINPVECTLTPIYQDSNECGIFDSVITSYDSILSTENNVEAINTDSIAYPEGQLLSGSITCTNNNTACERNDPPHNQLDYAVYASTKLGSAEPNPSGALTKVEYGDFSGNFDLTLEPTFTYNVTTPVMLFGDVEMSGNNKTLTLNAGDYFFNSLTFSGNNPSIVLADAATTRIFIKTDLNVSGNGLNINVDNNGDPQYLFVYVRGNIDFSTNGNVEKLNGFFYVEGEAKFNASSTNFEVHGGVTAEGQISITGNNGEFYQDSDATNIGHGPCTYGTVIQVGGPFDAWETSNHDASNPPNNKSISTKLVNKEFELSLGSLDKARTSYELKEQSAVEVAIYEYNSTSPISNFSSFNFDSSTSDTFTNIKVTSASKQSVVGFRFCSTYEGNGTAGTEVYTLYPTANCNGDTEVCAYETSSTPVWRVCSATDPFATRPDKLVIESTNTHMPDLLRAGTDYIMTIKAYDYDTTNNTNGYNQVSTNMTVNTDYWINPTFQANALSGTNGVILTTPTPVFSTYTMTDGLSLPTLSYAEIGFITIKLEDQNWANIDSSDTPSTCDEDGRYICGEQNLTYIPHHFGFSNINITNHNASVGNFTYLANLNKDDNATFEVSGRIEANIAAQNELNVITQNFDSRDGFYENDINVSSSIFLLTHGDANTTTIESSRLKGFTNGAKALAWDDTNLSQVLRFNFKRDINNTLNPFTVNATDVNLSAFSTYTGTASSSPDDINGTETGLGNGSTTFVYGRTNAPRSRFQADVNQRAFIYYEVFCDGIDSNNTPCSPNLLPNGVNSNYSDDPRWFINTSHTNVNFGTAGTVTQKGSSSTLVNQVTPPKGTHTDFVDLTYTGTAHPYKTTMENNASSWLIYNRFNANDTNNEFEVEFEGGSSAWAGEKTTDVTTDGNTSLNVNRRSMW